MDSSLALFEVDRVGRQVPVHDDVAVRMEVEALLADGRADEGERPERRVEGLTQLRSPRGLLAGCTVAALIVAEAHRERRVQTLAARLDLA